VGDEIEVTGVGVEFTGDNYYSISDEVLRIGAVVSAAYVGMEIRAYAEETEGKLYYFQTSDVRIGK
jgi:hypothetical protein